MVKAPSFEVTFGSGTDDKRLDKLEKDVEKLTKAVDKLVTQGGGSSGGGTTNVVNKVKKAKNKKKKQNVIKDIPSTLADLYADSVEDRDKDLFDILAMLDDEDIRIAEAKAKAQAKVDQAFGQQMAQWDKLAKASNKQSKKTGGSGRRGKKKKKDPPTPWGWVNNLLEGWNKADKKVGKIRTMTQRLKTAGGWFVETALMRSLRTIHLQSLDAVSWYVSCLPFCRPCSSLPAGC